MKSHRRFIAEKIAAPPHRSGEPLLEYSAPVGESVKTTTCYMCACRCGIRVHLKNDRIRYIEGNPDHPTNRGALCAKGSAGIMTQYSPARLTKPLLRVGNRGEGKFREIEWDEALALAGKWLSDIRASDPKRLAFFTGRDQSQALTGWWAAQFGTPNYAAHGGFCSVNMAAAGLYTLGGSFWEFGEPDWELTRYCLMFGVAEDHDSNPIKTALGRLKGRPAGSKAKFVSVNPIRTGYSAIADEWVGIKPGTDGIFVLALVHELIRLNRIDRSFLSAYTNASWLVVEAPGMPEHGLIARDAGGQPLCLDARSRQITSAVGPGVEPVLETGRVILPDGRHARSVHDLVIARYREPAFGPERAAEITGISADSIRRIAAELAEAAFDRAVTVDTPWTDWTGRRHDSFVGRPVSIHAMRGISAHANGFQTCRAIHLLQMLLGSIDVPGGWRYRPPFPRSVATAARPSGPVAPGNPLKGPPLGFPQGPEDLLIDAAGQALRIDKAFSWEAPLALHGMMHMVIHNAWKGDPYPIDTLFLYMANMAWNSAMNTQGTMRMLADKDPETCEYCIPHIIYADAYRSEMVAYADLVLPDTTYLERWDCISLLDRPIGNADTLADAIRQPVLPPDRDVRAFQDVLLDLGARLGLPGMTNPDGGAKYPGGLKDYMIWHERRPGIGMLAGWRGADGAAVGKGAPNPDQLERYVENGCYWTEEIPQSARYMRFANRDYLDWAAKIGLIDRPERIVLNLYLEPLRRFQLAAEGHGTRQPRTLMERARIVSACDPLPSWYPPFAEDQPLAAYPLHALTQRPMHMYHSWGSHNAWLRQIQARNPIFVARVTAQALGIADGDWVWIESAHGRVKAEAKLMEGVHPGTIWTWNAIGKRAGAWALALGAPEATKAFLLNHIIPETLPPGADGYRYANADPVTGQAAWFDLKVRLVKCAPSEAGFTEPSFPPQNRVGALAQGFGAFFSRGKRRPAP
jgi:sulfite dehydrogenase (quinone) subunit SoeA